jgi:hypothetical protein
MAINFEDNTICYGDRIELKTGKIVKVNSVDRKRKVFDYIDDDGEAHEVTENCIRNYGEEFYK